MQTSLEMYYKYKLPTLFFEVYETCLKVWIMKFKIVSRIEFQQNLGFMEDMD
jgi:hypothetical protein